MDFELEVFEIYDECGSSSETGNKKHSKHTRKKCKQKKSNINIECSDRDLSRSSKSSVLSGERRPISLRQSIISVFSKFVVWRDQRRYQSSVPDKIDSPHTSKDPRKGFVVCSGESSLLRDFTILTRLMNIN